MNDPELMGECDTCGAEYELASREGRCGDCGNCAEHCDHLHCNCWCGCEVPLDWGTCVDCGDGTHQNNNQLPERINVMKVITYDVAKICEDIHAETEKPFAEITIEEILERVETWAKDDFACGYGHEADIRDLVFQDENGQDL